MRSLVICSPYRIFCLW